MTWFRGQCPSPAPDLQAARQETTAAAARLGDASDQLTASARAAVEHQPPEIVSLTDAIRAVNEQAILRQRVR
jgi:hypothetical protein